MPLHEFFGKVQLVVRGMVSTTASLSRLDAILVLLLGQLLIADPSPQRNLTFLLTPPSSDLDRVNSWTLDHKTCTY